MLRRIRCSEGNGLKGDVGLLIPNIRVLVATSKLNNNIDGQLGSQKSKNHFEIGDNFVTSNQIQTLIRTQSGCLNVLNR